MDPLFTSQQVIDRLTERYRLYNYGSKDILIEGLTTAQIEVIGDLSLALNHKPSMTGSRIKRSYPRNQAAA